MLDLLGAIAGIVREAWRLHRRRTALVVVLALLAPLTAPLHSIAMKVMIDAITHGAARTATVSLVAYALMQVLGRASWLLAAPLRWDLSERLALGRIRDITRMASEMPRLEHLERPDYLDKLQLARSDANALFGHAFIIVDTTAVILTSTTTVILLASIHPLLVLLPTFGIPAIFAERRGARIGEAVREETAQPTRLMRNLVSVSSEATTVKELTVLGSGPAVRERTTQLWARITRSRLRGMVRGRAVGSLGFACFTGGFLAAVAFTFWLAIEGRATVGDVVMAMTLAQGIQTQVMNLAGIGGRLTLLGSVVDRSGWLQEYADSQRAANSANAPVPERLHEGLRVEHVSFTYPGTESEVLHNVSFDVPPGTSVAIVGENGCGKTTLVKLLCGFYRPSRGSICIDGQNLDDMDPGAWQQRISGVFQDFARFEFLTRENVGVGAIPSIDDDARLDGAIAEAAATDVLERLERRWDQQLGRQFEGGTELSGGQWQMLALARSTLRDKPLLLVLDEPSSALDAHAEHELFERYLASTRRVAQETGGVTVMVSHRYASARSADLIVVLANGRIVELGGHDDLMAQDGLYAELFGIQSAGYR